MDIWILFNEYREVMAVLNTKEQAEEMMKAYNEMSDSTSFFLEKHEVEGDN